MLTAGCQSFTYDANGNLTTKTENNNTTTYTWDYENKLTRITYLDQTINTFAYNGDGLRVQKTDSQGTLKFICDGTRYGAKLIAATNASNRRQVVYDYGLGLLRQKGVAGAKSYYHADGLGSTSRLTNASENATDAFQYEAWGNLFSRNGVTPTPFQYAGISGYCADSDIGFMMLGARYYCPDAGRFIARDPLRYVGSPNCRLYVRANPTGLADVSGRGRQRAIAIWIIRSALTTLVSHTSIV